MNKQHGLSIVELLIGLFVGLIILLGASQIFSWNLGSNMNAVKQQRLEQTVQVLTDMMAGDIRRAGYAKPGVKLTPQVGVGGGHYFADASCVLLSNSTTAENERFRGYKLQNGVIYRYDGAANGSCDASLANWSAVTDMSYIKVTRLFFDEGAVNLADAYDCSTDPALSVPSVPPAHRDPVRVSMGVEAVGLDVSAGNPVKRCVQFNVHRRNG